MTHFAKVFNGVVVKVIVAEPQFFETFVDDSPGEWVQTSYNTRGGVHYDPNTNEPSLDQTKALRKNYAGVGGLYNKQLDAFMEQQPFPSWTLNEQTCWWVAPKPIPQDGFWKWDEQLQEWKPSA
jgi:hypothetical protein